MFETVQVDMIPAGRANRPGAPLDGPYFITIHDTANPGRGANALMHAKYLKGDAAAALPVSWHFTVDDTRVVQHLPVTEHGWHAGDGSKGQGNLSSIGIEICENEDGNRTDAEARAARLVGDLLYKLKLPIEAVVQHNHWSGKNCPHIIRARKNGWEVFLDQVQTQLNEHLGEVDVPMTEAERKQFEALAARVAELEEQHNMKVPTWAQPAVDRAIALGLIEAPADGSSRDFFRILTIMYRRGLLNDK
ncbi:N-acetylmuramoyl-L-alanine amidase [Paenibacillus catalpae]|uniref:N-acetylmuramoyl-L-alanine amidase n=1 Tax=Paenibacillus catalpae TaxID=1045775 RepID=A0A1I1Y1D0_9BACL|nr:N-acetylmuramoyl-L-alanine amidase [Paenibacillus catalpae]SFE13505.1 N-acetylmuramoyl-L-alanine amidase [Paenibacillus catalpae]